MWCLIVWRWSRAREPDVSYYSTWAGLLQALAPLMEGPEDVRQVCIEKPVPP